MKTIMLSSAVIIGLVALVSCKSTSPQKSYLPQISAVVEARSSEEKQRDVYRHPAQTLAFFNLEPGMTVAEALPGGGWYSKILANYLGVQGKLYGINYADDMWPRFGFFDQKTIDNFVAGTAKFSPMVADATDNGIATQGFTFATMPMDLEGSVDRVVAIRALHNLNRFEAEAGTMTQALSVMHKLLKKDGMVGVVQHRLPESAPDAGSDGSRGYLKESTVIKAFEQAGFKLVAKSEINANPKDQPSASDIVWRLPPSYNGSGDDPQKRAAMDEIGESDRMTLLFKKK
ncbi:methyltransferase [Aliiglaciecola sp. LCG003]|uniref:class I SAM-dependent methyltransferase n=1 Tax=Aliiglaciecola sp. LCG003 TaxID=3053655 RepID=UPI002573DBBF|nr:methyltransferase [Aliiglaciecola sp. LCG003]WJG09030.1 methyltransferase [Aliiglaciecola sp. LCG003]